MTQIKASALTPKPIMLTVLRRSSSSGVGGLASTICTGLLDMMANA